jgi:hypothetical protein
MSRAGRTASRVTVMSGIVLLLAAALAYSATTRHYKGKTTQKRPISFTVSGTSVTGFAFTIVDRCPHRKILYVHNSGFPAMSISKNKFGGKFTAKAPAVATVTVSGTVSARTVSGTLGDRSKNRKTHKFCSGKASFKLHHK